MTVCQLRFRLIRFAPDWSKVNHQAGILTFYSNSTKHKEADKQSPGTSFALRGIRFGEFAQLDVACHKTEVCRVNLNRAVDYIAGYIHQYREVGPPEQRQGEVGRPLPRRRPSPATKKHYKAVANIFFSLFRLANHTSIAKVRTSLRNSIAVSPSLLLAYTLNIWDCASHRRRPKSDRLLGGPA